MNRAAAEERSAALRRDGFAGAIEPLRPLAPLTTWRIGGPAEVLATPTGEEDLARGLAWAAARGVDCRILGNGSNLLVDDAGVPGVVFRVRRVLDDVALDGPRVRAGAGISFPLLARRTAQAGLSGLEFAAGIPGTLGGALVMNAGWHEFETGNHVVRVRAIERDGRPFEFNRAECGFRYRGSRFRDRRAVVLSAELELAPGDVAEIEARLDAFAESRKRNQPTELPSCGSVFVQPPGDFAGRLIEQAGLKGTRVGSIEVSHKHANFFVNHGGGTSAQALELVERVEREVRRRFGVELTREFEYWK